MRATNATLTASALHFWNLLATMLDHELAVTAAQHYRTLRAEGVTVRKTVDLIIATFCIAHEHALLHDDRDFEPFVKHLDPRAM